MKRQLSQETFAESNNEEKRPKMMQTKPPRMFLIEYYDGLIRDLDVYTEQLLIKFDDNDMLPETPTYQRYCAITIEEDNWVEDDQVKIPESRRIIDYINKVREKAIEELRKVPRGEFERLRSQQRPVHKLAANERRRIEEPIICQEILLSSKIEKLIHCYLFVPNKSIIKLNTFVADFYIYESEFEIVSK